MPPYDQGSHLQSPVLMCKVSRRAIKYLEWEAPALTKSTPMLAALMGSASTYIQPYKPAPEQDATANQRVFPKANI